MKRFRPSADRGIVINTRPKPIVHTNAKIYTRPNISLRRLDSLMKGRTPHIAITRTQGGIGDVLMTLPTVKAMSKKYDCKIDYGTDFTYFDGALEKVVRHNPYIDKVIPYREVEGEKYDAVIDLTCPCVIHEKPGAEPISRINLFARHAGVALTDYTIDYTITDEEKEEAREFLTELNLHNKELILFNPFASTDRRNIPIAFATHLLVKMLERRPNAIAIVVTHSDTDRYIGNQIDWNNYAKIVNFKDRHIREIAAIMSYCDLTICPDSALLHLAGALHKPSFSFFGPTDARARLEHYPEAVAIWPAKQLKCKCWYDPCKFGHVCWKRLELGLCLDTIEGILDKSLLPGSPDIVSFGKQGKNINLYEEI